MPTDMSQGKTARYAVIFRAELNKIDADYTETTARMRELAANQYGCFEFASVTEGNQEISVSYWETEEHIRAWKQDPEHLIAQELGHSRWYKSYQVQIVKIIRDYSGNH